MIANDFLFVVLHVWRIFFPSSHHFFTSLEKKLAQVRTQKEQLFQEY